MKFPALILIALLTATVAAAGFLAVTITEVHEDAGSWIVTLTNSGAGWDLDAHPATLRKLATKVALKSRGNITAHFADLPEGIYAVLVLMPGAICGARR